MAQDSDRIIKLLNQMTKMNSANAESLDRLLDSISSKLDLIKNNDSYVLFKAYLEELTKSFEEKYNSTSAKFRDIENAIKTVYQDQENHVKNSDMRELFDVFAKSMNAFYEEEKKEQTVLANIESKLNSIVANKANREDIENILNFLRNDFENLNHTYQNTINNIDSNLKQILLNFDSLNQTQINVAIKQQTDIIANSIDTIIQTLQIASDKNNTLEKLLLNVATTENLKITQAVIDSLIQKTDGICEQIKSLSDKEDVNELKHAAAYLNEKIEDSATKSDFGTLNQKTDDLISQTEDVKHKLGQVSKNIETLPDTNILKEALNGLENKLDSLLQNIEESVVQDGVNDAVSKIETLKKDFEVIKDIISDMNNVISSRVLTAVENISFENASYDIKEHISKMLSKLPQKEDIDTFNDLLSKTNIIVDKLDDLPTHSDMDSLNTNQLNLVENLAQISTKDDIESLLSKADNIEKKIDDINFDTEFTKLFEKTSSIEDLIKSSDISDSNFYDDTTGKNLLNVSEYIENNLKNLAQEISGVISEIKAVLTDKKQNFSQIEDSNNLNISSVEQYLEELKTLLSSYEGSKVWEKLEKIEQDLNSFKEYSDQSLDILLRKLDNLNVINTDSFKTENQESAEELSQIEHKFQELSSSFSQLNPTDKEENNRILFISSKLDELGADVENLKKSVEQGLEQGFAYNAELLEEKTGLFQDLIKELRHASTNNIELFEKLTVADNKLMDIKSELELTNTDILNNLNNKNDKILSILSDLRKGLSTGIISSDISTKIKEDVEDFKNDSEIITSDNSEIIEDLYNRISLRFDDMENTLKDFIIGDIDAVIIKLDNLKSDLESNVQNDVPEVSQMKEYNEFIRQVNKFRHEQKEYFKKAVEYLDKKLVERNEELRSLIAVTLNNDEILSSIEELKKYLSKKIKEFKTSYKPADENDEITEPNKIVNLPSDISDEIKEKFEEISESIIRLSEDNVKIAQVLNDIESQIDSIKIQSLESDFNLEDENNLESAEPDFDFDKAFDLLSKDIVGLKKFLKELPEFEQISAAKNLSNQNNKILLALNSKIEEFEKTLGRDWLGEIKSYLENSNLTSLLGEINSKIDVLALAEDHQWVEDIKNVVEQFEHSQKQFDEKSIKLLNLINTKLDILAEGNDYDDLEYELENISDTIRPLGQNIKVLSESDAKLASMLDLLNKKVDIIADSESVEEGFSNLSDSDTEITKMLELLNQKIDILAFSDDTESLEDIKVLIQEQQDYIEGLESNKKIEAFKKCLEKLTDEINNLSKDSDSQKDEIKKSVREMKDSVMEAVVSIFNQISFVEESEDIKDFVEEKTEKINKNLEEVTKQLKMISSNEESEDYTYTMQDIETDLTKLRLALNEFGINASKQDALYNINDSLNRISMSVNSLSQDDIKNLKSDITNLLASTNASYDTLINGISKKVDNINDLVKKSNKSSEVMRQALIFIGEWIDSATNSMNQINENSEMVNELKSKFEDFTNTVENHTDILNTIDSQLQKNKEQLDILENKVSTIEKLEDIISKQEERIDRIELNLDKVLNVLEDIEDSGISRKIDKLDKQISKLSTNVEKLTSYVD